jgi:DNA processing protein
MGESEYPPLLKEIDAPPPLIAVKGRTELLQRPSLSIVGARNASALGRKLAADLARGLAGEGLTVVSGLARGIDAAAHQGALRDGTAAALAGGLDQIYPPEHADLHAAIGDQGLLLSEMPFGWTARAQDFPRRNRLIAGVSQGVIVVEAARRSGSLITARLATEAGREVFAVPGSPLDPRAEGPNDLLKAGAVLVRHLDDILAELEALLRRMPERGIAEADGDERAATDLPPLWDELDLFGAGGPAAPAPRFAFQDAVSMAPSEAGSVLPPRERLLALLGPVPVSIDDLARAAGLDVRAVTVIMMDFEAMGAVMRAADGGFCRLS